MRQKSNYREGTISGYPSAIIKTYERMAYEAEREKDYRNMHYYFQYADHWKKFLENNN